MTTKQSNTPYSDYINDTSKEYAMYVASSRAIPKVCDGLKDSTRKALWLMKSKSEKIKTISLAGEMISSGLYLHGDASAAGAISMLAAPFVNNVPLLDGIGSFGTRVAPVDGIAAPRYTYVKRGKAADYLLYTDTDIIPTKENYDGSNIEPEHFLPLIPLVLLNGIEGLAVGWSTSILPRNIKKLIAATIQALDGKDIKGLEPSFDYLDVVVNNIEGNSWEFRGRAEILDTSSVRINELPPGLSLENFKKRLNKMEEEDKISTYTDRSTDHISVTVKFRRGLVKDWTEDQVIDYFRLKEKATERIVVIDWNGKSIRQYENAESLVSDFVEWRLGWYTTRYDKKLADDEYELKYWQGVKACFDGKLPERLIKQTDKSSIMAEVATITTKFELDTDQIEKIVGLPTYRWATDFYIIVKDHIARLQGNIKEHKAILKSPTRIREIYRSELEELKKIK